MTDQRKRSIQQRWHDLQPSKTMLVWSCAGSVAVALVVGFTWGGWVTGGTAQDMADSAGDSSRYELASVICVERFLAAPDAQGEGEREGRKRGTQNKYKTKNKKKKNGRT